MQRYLKISLYGIRILQPGQLIGFLAHGIRKHKVTGNGLFHQLGIDLHATVVDALVGTVMLPLLLRHREAFQAVVDVHLGVDILNLPARRAASGRSALPCCG